MHKLSCSLEINHKIGYVMVKVVLTRLRPAAAEEANVPIKNAQHLPQINVSNSATK